MGTKGLLLGFVVALAGCSNADSEPSTAESSSESTPTVSVQTTCDRLFVQGDPRLFTRSNSLLIEHSNGRPVDANEAATVAAELERIAEASDDQIRPHVEGMHAAVDDLDSAVVSDYKLAATEVMNQCAEYVAGDYPASGG